MKYLNLLLLTLVGLLLLSDLSHAEPGGDLNLTNKASLSSRTGYDLTLGAGSSTDTIDFVIGGVREGYIDSTGLVISGGTLTSPTISGNLTFSTAAAKIIPGATSLTFRNNADSANNISITDAGVIEVRENIVQTTTAKGMLTNTSDSADNKLLLINGGGNFIVTRGAQIALYGNEEASGLGDLQLSSGSVATADLLFDTSNANRWIIGGTTAGAGNLIQNVTNGGSIIMAKPATSIIMGAASLTSDATASIGVPSLFILEDSAGGVPAHIRATADANGAFELIAKSRATDGTANTILQVNDTISQVNYNGADGALFIPAASIRVKVDGTPGTNDMPGRLEFYTTADGAASSTVALILDNAKLADFAGNIRGAGTVTSTRSSDIGWSVVNAVNQACNTTCTSACVVGIDTLGTGGFLGCAVATADSCVCAGAS